MLLYFNSLAILAHKKEKETPPDQILAETECAKVALLAELGWGVLVTQPNIVSSLIMVAFKTPTRGILRTLRDGNPIQQI